MKTFLVVILSASFCYAQTPREKIVAHYDKKWQVIKDPAAAVYYRTVEPLQDRFIVRHYFISGELQMEAECTAYKSELVYDGKRVIYYENGNPKSQEFYQNNVEYGTHHTFYKNGKPQKDVTFNNGKKLINRFYSPDGEDLLANGITIVQDTVFGIAAPFREIVEHKEMAAFAIRENDTVFLNCDQPARYKGDLQRDLRVELEYPAIAKELKLEGVVFILIQISKNGAIKKTSVIKGFDPSCNAEALRVIKGLDFWTAGQHHGKPVVSETVLPIEFRLKKKTDYSFLVREAMRVLLMR